jgi:hypothetical protein
MSQGARHGGSSGPERLHWPRAAAAFPPLAPVADGDGPLDQPRFASLRASGERQPFLALPVEP